LPLAGRVVVIGTPAEEGGAGKVRLLEAGVFRDVDVAMMIHPLCRTRLWRPTLGLAKVKVEYLGRAAHASASPWQGVNALNAVIGLFNALDMMRQQLRSDARIHGVITVGGQQANIIPEYTAAEFYLRSSDREYLAELRRRFQAAAGGAATATGCEVRTTFDPVIHAPMKPNRTMAGLFGVNLQRIAWPVDAEDTGGHGSTDAGNVSQTLPTIHPYIKVAPDGVPNHSRAFTEATASPLARAGMVAGAKALAMTALDLLADPEAVRAARDEFARTP
ncbi:MAG: peptidase dimerization domain-containing protein, partial [Candidatus Rokuibacteriota bacterium]